MKISNIKITTRVWMAAAAIFMLGGLLTAMAVDFGRQMYALVNDLYEHPFLVTKAIENAKTDVLIIRADIRAYVLAATPEERAHFIHTMELAQQDAEAQLEVVAQRYLGAQGHVDSALAALRAWDKLRAETLALHALGETQQAIQRTTIGGILQQQAAEVLDRIQVIVDFAARKAAEFESNSQAHYRAALNRFLLALAGIAALLLVVGYWFMRVLSDPLNDLLAATRRLQMGDLSARSAYKPQNEFGVLANAFNGMAEVLQTDDQVHKSNDAITTALMRADDLQSLCIALVHVLAEQTGAQMAAIYLYDQQKKGYEHCYSLGLNERARRLFPEEMREGEPGLAIARDEIVRISNIPADTSMLFSAVSGELKPREIVTVPLTVGGSTAALVSLASLNGFSDQVFTLLAEAKELLATRVNEMLVVEANRRFARQLEEQNAELQAQARELESQAGELQVQNAELETQKRRLDEASRLKSTFLSNMSHELRTPLNSVITLSGVLSRRLKGKLAEDEFEYLSVVERNARHLLNLINDVLDLSRIEAGKADVVLSEFDAAELVDEVITMIAPQAQEKNIYLRSQMQGGGYLLRSDRSKCLHILQNLIGNAVKFTEQGGVEVSASRSGEMLEIAVRDSGIGIHTGQIPYIFDEFRQGDESAARRYEGTGLGLAIAKKYALMLGGDISVQSRPGEGSTFTLSLPHISTGKKDLPEADVRNASTSAQIKGKRILVLEDNPAAVVQIKDVLLEFGTQLEVATDGRQGLEALQAACPDAVILDLNMPGMDGFEFLEKLRARDETCTTPVLILTARQVSKEELSFLKGNNIYQLVRKGDLERAQLQELIIRMLTDKKNPRKTRLSQKRKTMPEKNVILVVDDNDDNRKSLRALLEESYEIMEAADCTSALSAADAGGIDLVLTDVSLPDGDCRLMIDKARKHPVLKDVPVVAVTAHAMAGDRKRFLAMGFDDYVAKPVDAQILEKIVRRLLNA